MKKLLFIFLLPLSLLATDRVSTGVTRPEVVTALGLCSTGDRLVIPAGSAEWTSALNVNKSITITGAGTNLTFITNNCPDIEDAIFEVSANSVTISNISFWGTNYGLVNGGFWGRAIELSALYGRAKYCFYSRLFTATIQDRPGTVIWKCVYKDNDRDNRFFGAGDGSANWTAYGPAGTYDYCSTNCSVLEDCIIEKSASMPNFTGVMMSSQQGQIWVVRNNQITVRSSTDFSPLFDFHGPTSGGPLRGGIAGILSSNYVNFIGSGSSFDRFVDIRGGSFLCYSNVVTNYVDSAGVHMRIHVGDAGLYFQNGGIEQVTNCWFWQNFQNTTAMPITVEAGNETEIKAGLSFTNIAKSGCIGPSYPFPLRDDVYFVISNPGPGKATKLRPVK